VLGDDEKNVEEKKDKRQKRHREDRAHKSKWKRRRKAASETDLISLT